jgi:hypothetical protein
MLVVGRLVAFSKPDIFMGGQLLLGLTGYGRNHSCVTPGRLRWLSESTDEAFLQPY